MRVGRLFGLLGAWIALSLVRGAEHPLELLHQTTSLALARKRGEPLVQMDFKTVVTPAEAEAIIQDETLMRGCARYSTLHDLGEV